MLGLSLVERTGGVAGAGIDPSAAAAAAVEDEGGVAGGGPGGKGGFHHDTMSACTALKPEISQSTTCLSLVWCMSV